MRWWWNCVVQLADTSKAKLLSRRGELAMSCDSRPKFVPLSLSFSPSLFYKVLEVLGRR
jgi:hypothetical protein